MLSNPRRALTSITADYSADEADEETQAHIQKEIDEAEKEGHDTGRPGSFLNRLISYGNDKTDREIAREIEEAKKREAAGKMKGEGTAAATAAGQGEVVADRTKTT